MKKKQTSKSVTCQKLEICILDTWGDMFYVGLNGIEIYDKDMNLIPLTIDNIDANPRDMNSIQGYSGDYRTVDKLINGENQTSNDRNMWLIPYNKGQNHFIYLDFKKKREIRAIKFYNYNKSPEDTLRGSKIIWIKADGKFRTPRRGIVIKKSIGQTLKRLN